MPDSKNNKLNKVLVAPLDWGLGHATRCIPLIRQLLNDGNQVFLAGSGASGHLLQQRFPDLDYQEIPSHTVHYAGSGKGQTWTLLQQVPTLFRQMRMEKKWLQTYLNRQPIDKLISDNRYGLHHPGIQNILITHQLNIRSGISRFADKILQLLLIRLLKNFQEVWVPDGKEEPSLSGALGHPHYRIPIPVTYIGILSRFTPTHPPIKPNTITIILSGPEPQRTLLEEKCLRELGGFNQEIRLIRGLPKGGAVIHPPAQWQVFDHLSDPDLQQMIEESELIIARSGYSTLMDLETLHKKAILIPTPGQPEQEYLAQWVKENRGWTYIEQKHSLAEAIKRSLPNQPDSHKFTRV